MDNKSTTFIRKLKLYIFKFKSIKMSDMFLVILLNYNKLKKQLLLQSNHKSQKELIFNKIIIFLSL